jgi:RNA polymerase sigma factor (sigma-70 family)
MTTLTRPTPTALPADPTLWQQVRAGDRAAFEAIYAQHVQTLYRYGYSLWPDHDGVLDAIHDVFVDIWTKRERLGDTDSVKFYLIKSIKNRIYNALEARRRWQTEPLGTDAPAEWSTPSPEERYVADQDERQQAAHLDRYLHRLPPRQQEALRLRFFEGLEYRQVAEVLGVNQQSAYNLIFRALEELRRHWPAVLLGLTGGFLGGLFF